MLRQVNHVILHIVFTEYIDILVKNCSNYIANSLELLQSCTRPSIWLKLHSSMKAEAYPTAVNNTVWLVLLWSWGTLTAQGTLPLAAINKLRSDIMPIKLCDLQDYSTMGSYYSEVRYWTAYIFLSKVWWKIVYLHYFVRNNNIYVMIKYEKYDMYCNGNLKAKLWWNVQGPSQYEDVLPV